MFVKKRVESVSVYQDKSMHDPIMLSAYSLCHFSSVKIDEYNVRMFECSNDKYFVDINKTNGNSRSSARSAFKAGFHTATLSAIA